VVLGYVVDGGSRDRSRPCAGFPAFCRSSHLRRRALDSRVTASVTIGTVTTAPRLSLGDRDGVVIIPRAIVETSSTGLKKSSQPKAERGADGGMDPVEAYNRYGKF
jgi:regulator of RNase E activity RraA